MTKARDLSVVPNQTLGMKNRLIDTGFIINQRGYASGASLSAGSYAHDRWKAGASGCTYTFTQGSLGVPITITITAGSLQQIIEGCNMGEGGTYILSWTGTAQARINGGSYSTSPLIVSGITAGANTTIEFGTGTVLQPQLEKGSTATSFDYRPYGTELALCQRYYAETPNDAIYAIVAQGQWNGSVASAIAIYPEEMRAAPTVAALGTNAGSWYVQQGNTEISTASTTFSGAWGSGTSRRNAWLDFSNLSGGVSNAALTVLRKNQSTSNRNGCLSFNAEL